MKRSSTLFLKSVICVIGLLVITVCGLLMGGIIRDGAGYHIWVILVLYASVVPFIYALYQGLKLLGYIDKNTAFSIGSVKALTRIKYSALAIVAMFSAGTPALFYVAQKDDAPGILAFGLIIIFLAVVVATFASLLQRLFLSAMEIKSENDLTV